MHTIDLRLPVHRGDPKPAEHPELQRLAAQALGLPPDAVAGVRVQRQSLDARKRSAPAWQLRLDVRLAGDSGPQDELPPLIRPQHVAQVHSGLRPIIVGMGPAGLFAALAFADAGVRCTLLDRGVAVEPRSLHVRDLRSYGQLHEESNLCYGEGGAGTYSDGKLYTRSKHAWVQEVYERLVQMGAGREILYEAHPHVGTNRLIPMLKLLRKALLEAGHDLRFSARMDDLIVQSGPGKPRVVGVVLQDGTELRGGPVILATGHSARDTYRMLARRGVALQRKDFAIGARVEHPQALIDQTQLGPLAGDDAVGAAEYFLAQTVPGGRGCYSFCMCPGGFVLPSPTQAGCLNVNGMSNASRGSDFANAAWVAQVQAHEFFVNTPGDLDDDPEFGAHVADGALMGLALQTRLEQACFAQGGSNYHAPAQRLVDFCAGRDTQALPERYTYRPGVVPGRLDQLLPKRLVRDLVQGARQVDRAQLRGWLSRDALMVGVETTTSSPVRVPRGDDRQSISHADLYPCAEGAGYAGGIVSSAIEGLEAARTVLVAHGVLAGSDVPARR